jgi:hypothetical protein
MTYRYPPDLVEIALHDPKLVEANRTASGILEGTQTKVILRLRQKSDYGFLWDSKCFRLEVDVYRRTDGEVTHTSKQEEFKTYQEAWEEFHSLVTRYKLTEGKDY